ncbi:hypothetical protein I4F81_003300 [Pyropia yezoensis]|uniref:Uncharacterized protein n=1 Tax=Pyropia yezoensis TaxID=2788 RepID=A0ACC3BT80_PYRYE|nr:hypothetical protein I4F81_003300 [Neopyropia yezoensis]
MIEIVCDDRLGKKIRVKCNPDDTIADLKKLIAAQTGTRAEKLRLQKWYTVYKDHITLAYVFVASCAEEHARSWACHCAASESLVWYLLLVVSFTDLLCLCLLPSLRARLVVTAFYCSATGTMKSRMDRGWSCTTTRPLIVGEVEAL